MIGLGCFCPFNVHFKYIERKNKPQFANVCTWVSIFLPWIILKTRVWICLAKVSCSIKLLTGVLPFSSWRLSYGWVGLETQMETYAPTFLSVLCCLRELQAILLHRYKWWQNSLNRFGGGFKCLLKEISYCILLVSCWRFASHYF